MSKATHTPILLDTSVLSKIVSDLLDELGAPSTKKSACLNRAAARISGPKHNWGFLTGHDGQVTAQGVEQATPTLTSVPDFVIKGAEMALRENKMAPQNLVPNLAHALATAYLLQVPAACDVFTSEKEVKNDLIHNRGQLVSFIAHEGMHIEVATQRDLAVLKNLDKITESKPESILSTPNPQQGTRVGEIVGFMLSDRKNSSDVCSYMIENTDQVQKDFNEGITPATWQRVAVMVEKAKSIDPNSEEHPGNFAALTRAYIKANLGSYADEVIAAAGL